MDETISRRIDAVERAGADVRHAQSQHEAVCAERYQRILGGQERVLGELSNHTVATAKRMDKFDVDIATLMRCTAQRRGADDVLLRVYNLIYAVVGGLLTLVASHFWPSR